MNKLFTLLSLALGLSIFIITGCASSESTSSGQRKELDRRYNPSMAHSYRHRIRHRRYLEPIAPIVPAVVKPEPVKPEPIKPVVQNDCPGLLVLRQSAPRKSTIGETYIVEADLIPCDNVGDVRVRTDIPDGLTLVKSDPNAQVVGNELTWNIDYLAKGEVKKLKAWLRPNREGDFVVCFRLQASPVYCVDTRIGKPVLVINKTGPATAPLGGNVTYNIVVENKGTSIARGVSVTDNIPDGLVHSEGKKSLTFQVGDLTPKASKSFKVTLKASQPGNFCNVATVTSTNAGTSNSKACTRVLRQTANLAITCPPESFLGKRASNKITITNTGDVALTKVAVAGSWSAGMRIISAEGSPSLADNKAVWNIASLAPGKSLSYGIVSVSKTPGKQCIDLTLTCAEGITKKASCCTEWKGFPAILLEVIDTNDPLLIDEETTYVIEVTNQGTALDRNIRIVAKFPAEITPLSTSGDTKGTISGKNVSFAAYPILNPKDKIKFVIKAKGVKTGDSRLKVELSAESLGGRPVSEEESTHVY